MQHHQTTLDPNDPTLRMGPAALRLIVPGLALAAIGGGTAAFCFGRVDHQHAPGLFYHAYLIAFVFYLTVTLGSLFFVMLHHLARSGWSVTVRRLAEALSANVFLMAVLFLPIAMPDSWGGGLEKIYSWAANESAAAAPNQAEKTAAPEKAAEDGLRDPSPGKPAALRTVALGDDEKASPQKSDNADNNKSARSKEKENDGGATKGYAMWQTVRGFRLRAVLCFVIWGFLAWYFRGHSILQDTTGSVVLSKRMERLSAPAMFAFGATLTIAAIDLIMSLNSHWYSTMIGVYLFADVVLTSFVAITLLALTLQSWGLLRGAISVEHYHDLGKLTFAFVFFWGYIAFSQYMLIWYANMPEETQFFMPREIGPWIGVSLALIVIHFVLPFVGLMSRHVKRFLPAFAFWLFWLLLANAFDLFWLIMPNVYVRQMPAAAGTVGDPLPEALKKLLSAQTVYQLDPKYSELLAAVKAPLAPAAIATVIGLLVFMGGLYIASTGWLLSRARLVPIKDPRLPESLHFHNT